MQDHEVTGAKAGVFLETFYKPKAAVQVNALSVRAFDAGDQLTGATGDQWDALVRAQHVATRCDLLDPKRAGAGAGVAFATRCGDVVFVQADQPATGGAVFDRILEARRHDAEDGRRGSPTARSAPGSAASLPPPTPPSGTTDSRSSIGRVACLDLGDSTAVVWSHEPAGVIGVVRVKDDDRAGVEGLRPRLAAVRVRRGAGLSHERTGCGREPRPLPHPERIGLVREPHVLQPRGDDGGRVFLVVEDLQRHLVVRRRVELRVDGLDDRLDLGRRLLLVDQRDRVVRRLQALVVLQQDVVGLDDAAAGEEQADVDRAVVERLVGDRATRVELLDLFEVEAVELLLLGAEAERAVEALGRATEDELVAPPASGPRPS